MTDSRGSIWRKWDLHVHTPASHHWNGGKRFFEMNATERSASLAELVKRVQDLDVAAFAIMDYWTFAGYLEAALR